MSGPEKKGRKCRYCETEIFWAASANSGKMIPLEVTPIKIWVRAQSDSGRVDPEEPRVVMRQGYRNHFETCPGADQARSDAKARRTKQELERDPSKRLRVGDGEVQP